ncbi:MAG: polysaccharide deacetylase family protein [Lachnospiraceae bacterium]|nr:polysaccharide deacetylase family protein [Lachnospiraceae bacterium]
MNNKMTAVFTVNLDGECFWSGMFEGTEKRPKTLSMGDYGIKRGLDRVLKTLKEHEITATVFVPGLIAKNHPDAVEKILDGGHELAFHGHTHRPMHLLKKDEIEEEFALGTEVLAKLSGKKPLGFRAPEGEVTKEAFEAAVSHGYGYSSSLYDNDMPYWHKDLKGSLLEIPMNWNLHDFPYFAFNYGPAFPSGQGRVSSYQRVTENYIEEFDAYLHYGLTYVPQFTPQSIGSPGKIQILEKILAHVDQYRDEIEIRTCGELLGKIK